MTSFYGYYGYKLKADGTFLYDIRRGLVTRGLARRQLLLGRLYYVDPPHGVSAPVTLHFKPYCELSPTAFLYDVLLRIKYRLRFLTLSWRYKLVSKR